MKTYTLCHLLLVLFVVGCGEPACFDLVYNPMTKTCDCPHGTTPNYVLDRCEGEDGRVIPWSEVEPMYAPQASPDGGTGDAAVGDAGLFDSGDGGPEGPADANLMMDVREDAEAQPPSTPAIRSPWNGFASGSPHTPDAPSAGHPLRPKFTWTSVPESDTYQIQLTRNCDATRFMDCDFSELDLHETTAEPEFTPTITLTVSDRIPVGARYFWRVRACRGTCSAWSEVHYLDVGRSSHDYNGDGYADVLVGADGQDGMRNGEGTVYLFFGSLVGLSSTPGAVLQNPRPQESAQFGYVVTSAGDLNADGYADILVGAPQHDSPQENAGAAYIFLGGSAGPSSIPTMTLTSGDLATGDLFGYAGSGLGDVNADGFADVAVGAVGHSGAMMEDGAAYIFLGSISGTTRSPRAAIPNPEPSPFGGFGSSISDAGDVNGDGVADFLIGASHQSGPLSEEGRVYFFLGNQVADFVEPDMTLANPASETQAWFGASVASAGDVDGDGYSDVVVGAPRLSAPESREGVAFVYNGSARGLSAIPTVLDNPLDQPNAQFGWSVSSAGDVNGDGFFDVVIGADRQNDPERNEGAAYVFLGSSTGIVTVPSVSLDDPLDQADAGFGVSVRGLGDLDGDGFDDLVVGAWSSDTTQVNVGAAYVFVGTMSGTRTRHSVVLINPENQVNGFFGGAVGKPRR